MDRADDAEVFVAVADAGGFSAAARRLNRSPAAITRSVAELEARLGVRLLNRTTRAVSLTDAGRRFLTGAKQVLADLTEIEQAAAGHGVTPRGELSVTAPVVFGRRHVLPVVTEFLRQFPDVSVRLTLLDRPVDLVQEGFDVAIRIGTLADTSAVATRVGSVHRIVVASPGYIARRGEPKKPEDLAEHDIVAFIGLDRADAWTFTREKERIDARIHARLIVTTAEASIDAATSGLGITRMLSYQPADALASGALVRLLRAFEGPDLPVHVVYPDGKHPPPKLRAFLDAIVPGLRRRCAHVAQSLSG